MMSERQHPRFIAEGEVFTFPVGGEAFCVEGPCYVSSDETSIYFPDHNLYMSVPRWQQALGVRSEVQTEGVK